MRTPQHPTTTGRAWPGIASALLAAAVGAGAGLYGIDWTLNRTAASSADAFPPPTAGWNGLRAFVVVSPTDCESNLHFIGLFQRDTLRLRLQELLVVAKRGELAAAVANIRAQELTTPVSLASSGVQREIKRLGAKMTPFVVILDGDRVVRLAMHVPPDIDANMAFPGLLRALALQGGSNPLVPPE